MTATPFITRDVYGGFISPLYQVVITEHGQLYDETSGSLLYDEATGAPITI